MLIVVGQGYTGGIIRAAANARGWKTLGVKRVATGDCLAFNDPALPDALAAASHIISTVPPDTQTGIDPVLAAHGDLLAQKGRWVGYLSSTGVYGDTAGAWVDEGSPIGGGRRSHRTAADIGWGELGAAIFRLPGIYGPTRSALDQVRAGTARRVDRPGHRFNRIHVEDIAGAVLAAMECGFRGILNVVDDLPAEPREITEFACNLLGVEWPELRPIEIQSLSPMARAFWTEQRQVSGAKLHRMGYRLRHPDYKAGLAAIDELERLS